VSQEPQSVFSGGSRPLAYWPPPNYILRSPSHVSHWLCLGAGVHTPIYSMLSPTKLGSHLSIRKVATKALLSSYFTTMDITPPIRNMARFNQPFPRLVTGSYASCLTLQILACRLLRLGPGRISRQSYFTPYLLGHGTILFRVAHSPSRDIPFGSWLIHSVHTSLVSGTLHPFQNVAHCLLPGQLAYGYGTPTLAPPPLDGSFQCALGAEHVFLGWGFGTDHPSRLSEDLFI